MEKQLRDDVARMQRQRSFAQIPEFKCKRTCKAGMNSYRGCHGQPETSPRRAAHNVRHQVRWKAKILESAGQDELMRMNKQGFSEGHVRSAVELGELQMAL